MLLEWRFIQDLCQDQMLTELLAGLALEIQLTKICSQKVLLTLPSSYENIISESSLNVQISLNSV